LRIEHGDGSASLSHGEGRGDVVRSGGRGDDGAGCIEDRIDDDVEALA
jgi:hypothetical protein